MIVIRILRPSATALVLVALIGARSLAVNDVAGNLTVVNDNGAWSWFEDERAIIDLSAGSSGKLLVSSIANSAGTGGAARQGDVEVASLDLATNAVTRFTLKDAYQADDHNTAALWRRPDGRYVAVYAQHNAQSVSHYRVSTNPGDISSWGAESSIAQAGNTTYSNVHYMSSENGGNGLLYNFTRTLGLDAHVDTSTDQGLTWTAAGRLLDWPVPIGDPKYTGTDGSRPYVKYASNGVDEIHFFTSTDHPRGYDNSIYAGVVKNGKVYDSFGTEVDNNLFDGTAKKPTDYTTVFNTDTSPLSFAWTTDYQLDSQSRPLALFTARNGSSSTDHRILYARFTGTQWDVHEVAKMGGYLYAAENDYTGLGALDPRDPNRIFISTPIDPRTDVTMPHYEIFSGLTTDGGATWAWTPITFNSTMDNLRPIVPKWDANHTALLWMRGAYSTYTSYDLDVVGLTSIGSITPNILGDLDFDQDVDLDDYALYLTGLNGNLTGLSVDDAYRKGDLNGDFLNNFQDFLLFRGAYDMAHGAGAFSAATSGVPEPSTGLLALLVVTTTVLGKRRRSRHGLTSCHPEGGSATEGSRTPLQDSSLRCAPLRMTLLVAACGLLLGITREASAIDIKVDIDSRRVSGSDTSGAITTQSGYTSWDLTNVAANGTTLAVSGVTFEIFGLAGSNQSRNRGTNGGGGGTLNNALTDFVYNEGAAGRSVGLRISGLPVGTYAMQSWHYDSFSTVITNENYTQVEVQTQGVAGSTVTIADMVPFSTSPIPYLLYVTAPGQVKEVIFREDDVATPTDSQDSNRARLNAFTIATPVELTLELNTTTGAARIINNDATNFDLSYYEVRSVAGSLTPNGWMSLDSTEGPNDTVGNGWDVSPNANTKLLNEARLIGTNSLAPGQSEYLGSPFAGASPQDVLFFYAGPNDASLRTGLVKYIATGGGVTGDYNNNGVVDAADYVLWRNGGPLQNEGRSTGVSDSPDYYLWRARLGATAAGTGTSLGENAPVPEPASLGITLAGLIIAAALRRQPVSSIARLHHVVPSLRSLAFRSRHRRSHVAFCSG